MSHGGVPYAATATRLGWDDLPPQVRRLIASRTGEVAGVRSAGGGFSGGFAAEVRAVDGSAAFVKAVNRSFNPYTFDSYYVQAEVTAELPEGTPSPALLWTELVEPDWVVLALERVGGVMPGQPWTAAQLERVGHLMAALGRACAHPRPGRPYSTVAGDVGPIFGAWRRLAGVSGGLAEVPAWVRSRVDELAELEDGFVAASVGTSLVHLDLRPDNLLLDDDAPAGGWVCDWTIRTLGAPWIDLVSLLPTAHDAGLDVDTFVAAHPVSRDVDPRDIDCFLASIAGYHVESAPKPDPIGGVSPWLRRHQRHYGAVTLSWLRRRRRWT